MSEDLGTVNLKQKTMARDIEALRQRYFEHKQGLERLASEAPTEALALRYRQLIAEIDSAVRKLADLEREADGTMGEAPDPALRRTSPGTRPLRGDPQMAPLTVPVEKTGTRTALILILGLLVLATLGYFVWDFATGPARPATAAAPAVAETVAPETVETATPPQAVLRVEPLTQDYGTVRRGTRATRQFELLNSTDQPLTIRANRSDCRCLWFEYADTIPPQGSTTMTVTVDGAKAPVGPLRETVQVASKTDPAVTTAFDVVAQVE